MTIIWRTKVADVSDEFMTAAKSSQCQPRSYVLLFHKDFDVNVDLTPPTGTKFLDITSRVNRVGSLDRRMPSKPGEATPLYVGDCQIDLENSDNYFSEYLPGGIFYAKKFVGYDWENRVEMWYGFQYGDTIEVLLKAVMSIASLTTSSQEGVVALKLKDFISAGLGRSLGYIDTETGEALPFEVPRYYSYSYEKAIIAWGTSQGDLPDPDTDFIKIAAGVYHSLGLKSDGTIVGWGNDTYGQITVPSPNSDFIQVAAGYRHSLGLKSDGTIVAWGNNTYGQATAPSPNADFIKISTQGNTNLALKSDGTIVAWGNNTYGQATVPSPNSDFIDIASGYYHSLGLKSTKIIAAWGQNTYGQCTVPAPNSNFESLGIGTAHSLGIKTDGTLVTWGRDIYGLMTIPSPNSDFSRCVGGRYHTIAVKTDGTIVAWGNNEDGQCDIPEPNGGFTEIAASHWHSLAIRDLSVNKLKVRSEHTPPGEWVEIEIPSGYLGIEEICYFLTKNMNAEGLLTGGSGDPNKIRFKASFEEKDADGYLGTKYFTIEGTGGSTDFEMDNTGLPPLGAWMGFNVDGVYTSVEGKIVSNIARDQSVSFLTIMQRILTEQGLIPETLWEVEDVPVDYFRVVFPCGTTIAQAAARMAESVGGLLYTQGPGNLCFYKFSSLPQEAKLTLDSTTNYKIRRYTGADINYNIRRLIVSGRFKDSCAELESGMDGQDISLYNDCIESAGQALAVGLEYIGRFNIIPTAVEIEGENLPHVEPGDNLIIYDYREPFLLSGHATIVTYAPNQNKTNITLRSFQSVMTIVGKVAFDNYMTGLPDEITQGAKLLSPQQTGWLQTKLFELSGYRVYELFVENGLTAKFLSCRYGFLYNDTMFFFETFDTDPTGRYTLIGNEAEGYSDIGTCVWNPVDMLVYLDGRGAANRGANLRLEGINLETISDNFYAYIYAKVAGADPTYGQGNSFNVYASYRSSTDMIHHFLRAVGSTAVSPAVYRKLAGAYTRFSDEDLRAYAQLNQPIEPQVDVNAIATRGQYNPIYRTESFLPIPSPTTGASTIAFGFSRACGTISAYTLVRRSAQTPATFTILLWSRVLDGAVYKWLDADSLEYPAGGTPAANADLLPAGIGIKVKAQMSRGSMFLPFPALQYVLVNYSKYPAT